MKRVLAVLLGVMMLLSVGFICPAMANTGGEGSNLLENGSFETNVAPPTFNFKNLAFETARVMDGTASDGEYYLDLKNQTGQIGFRIENLKPYTNYRMRFDVKSSKAGAVAPNVRFYGTTQDNETEEYKETYFKGYDIEYDGIYSRLYGLNRTKFGAEHTEDTDRNTWYTYAFDVPVQSDKITATYIRLDFDVQDPYLCIDNLSFTEEAGAYNYLQNGSLENLQTKDSFYIWSGSPQKDQSGNHTRYIAGNQNKDGLFQTFYATSGRYKLSFRVKKDVNETDLIPYFKLIPKTNAEELDSKYGFRVISVPITIAASMSDWVEVEYYFSMPKDAQGKDILYLIKLDLPTDAVSGTVLATGGHYDDIRIEKESGNHISFASRRGNWMTGGMNAQKGTELSAITEEHRGTLVSASAIVYPQKEDGVNEKARLIVCIYKTVNGVKRLEAVEFEDGENDESGKKTDAVPNGADANGIILLNTAVRVPADADAGTSIKAFLFGGESFLLPLTDSIPTLHYN